MLRRTDAEETLKRSPKCAWLGVIIAPTM